MKTLVIRPLLVLAPLLLPMAVSGQKVDRTTNLGYLKLLHEDLKRSYYDRTFRGYNLEEAYDSAKARINRAGSDQECQHAIELYLQPLNDSHTFFVAPRRIGLWHFNFGIRFHGDAAFVIAVDSATQAESAGLRVGDEIARFDGQPFTRATYEKVLGDFLASDPIQPLDLAVLGADRSMSHITVRSDTAAIYRLKGAAFRKLLSASRDSSERASSHVQATLADTVFLWRLPQFTHEDKGIDEVMKRVRQHRVLVLDLRGNGGGSIKTLTKLVSHFIDRQLIVGDVHTRTGTLKYTAKPNKQVFAGQTYILVDSETGSASEIFARIMQLEGKATVVGDRTAGAVMISNFFPYEDYVGASITVSDFVLYNGERLEKMGVKPDVAVLPTAPHIAARSDPALAWALQRAGLRVSPISAGRLLQHAPR